MKINYYLYGHENRNMLAKDLARKLFADIENDNEIFFVVKKSVNMFRGYKGQPVVIWEDFTAESLKLCLGMEAFKGIFNTQAGAPFMITDRGNIPLDVVNIVTGPQNCQEFFIKLATNPKNLVDITRRFGALAEVRADGYETYVNAGHCNGGNYANFQRVSAANFK